MNEIADQYIVVTVNYTGMIHSLVSVGVFGLVYYFRLEIILNFARKRKLPLIEIRAHFGCFVSSKGASEKNLTNYSLLLL